ETVRIRLHLGEHGAPIRDGRAYVGQDALQLPEKILASARIGAVELDIDNRFRRAFSDLLDPALLVASALDDRMKKPVDRKVPRRDRARDAVHEERHILV